MSLVSWCIHTVELLSGLLNKAAATRLDWSKHAAKEDVRMNHGMQLMLGVFVAGCLCAAYKGLHNSAQSDNTNRQVTPVSQSKTGTPAPTQRAMTYSEAGISLQYPKTWRSFPSQAVSQIKANMATELRKYDRTLISLAMFISSDEEVAFFVSKVRADKPLTDDDILAERRKFYEDAVNAGDVTRINTLEKTTVKDLPAVVEDIERQNGGRGRTVKLLKGDFLIELSLIVNKKSNYDKYFPDFETIIATLTIEE